MTGMFAALALSIAGLMASASFARMMRTFAPWAIRLSTSASCCSLLSLASVRVYDPPPASTAFLMFGSSALAQRSWV